MRLVRYSDAAGTVRVGVQADGVTRRLPAPSLAALLAALSNTVVRGRDLTQ